MDAFADLLRDLRADSACLGQEVLEPPFALRFSGDASLILCAPLRGEGWLAAPEGRPRRLGRGDTAIVRGPASFVFADGEESAARPAVYREVRCDGSGADREISSRTCGADPDGSTALLVGEYRVGGEVGRRLMETLPGLLIVPCEHEGEEPLSFIEAEVAAERPGQQVVLERLLDWFLICTLRTWFDSPGAAAPPWYRALHDPVVGAALRAIHRAPGRAWTVALLAAEADVSRATLAKRFTDAVGEPPLAYLAEWRMTLAADLLAEPGATVAAVARQVGYADAFGFSAAFKRLRGVSPSGYRAARAAAVRNGTPSPQPVSG